MSWYARIVADVAELEPAMAPAIKCAFAAIACDAHDSDSECWRSVVNTIAEVLRCTTVQHSSRPYRRLEAFVHENEDLLTDDLVIST